MRCHSFLPQFASLQKRPSCRRHTSPSEVSFSAPAADATSPLKEDEQDQTSDTTEYTSDLNQRLNICLFYFAVFHYNPKAIKGKVTVPPSTNIEIFLSHATEHEIQTKQMRSHLTRSRMHIGGNSHVQNILPYFENNPT